MLTKFYNKFYLYIYKDIKHLVRKNYKLHNNNVFLIVKFNKYACKTTTAKLTTVHYIYIECLLSFISFTFIFIKILSIQYEKI
jgi:hypothetical protein